jgi:hypothetical protein
MTALEISASILGKAISLYAIVVRVGDVIRSLGITFSEV